MEQRHKDMIINAANSVVGVADDLGMNLIDVIAEMERYIVEKTKVGDATKIDILEGRRGYTLKDGRLVQV